MSCTHALGHKYGKKPNNANTKGPNAAGESCCLCQEENTYNAEARQMMTTESSFQREGSDEMKGIPETPFADKCSNEGENACKAIIHASKAF